MKKILSGLILILIIIGGVHFGVSASRSLSNDKGVLPAVTVNSANEGEDSNVQERKVGLPKTLEIPKINVDTTIESVGLDSKRNMDVPKDSDNVAWYNLGPKPGEPGSSVIAGHKDEVSGAPSVFWDLKKLEVGDKLLITDENGDIHTFSVTAKKEYPDADFPVEKVFSSKGPAMLNLITCEGVFNQTTKNYTHRTVIFSQLDE